jgi:probable HAF family extracellular repeat protein
MSSYPRAINDAGQVVGSSTYYVNTGYGAAVVSRAFFYDGHAMTVLPVPGLQSWASDINDAGQIVGYAGGRAFLFENGTYTDLNALVPPGQPALTAAVAINNAGQIVSSNLAGRAVLLTPVDAARVIDDGDAGFSTAGPAPAVIPGQGCEGDVRRLYAPSDRLLAARGGVTRFRSQATWTFGDVAAGTYRVSATWTAGPDRAAAAPFTVFSNRMLAAATNVDQRHAPAGFISGGDAWSDLATVTVSGGTVSVRLTNETSGRVIADAVRLERLAGAAVAQVAYPPALAASALRRRIEGLAPGAPSDPALW